MTKPVIVEEYRNGYLENTHQGIVCIINDQKEVIYEKGDSEQHVFYRSAMKPIQAIPFFTTKIDEKYNLTQEEIALLTASQRGEIYHQKALASLIEKLGLSEEQLVCGKSYPLNDEPKEKYIWEHQPKRKLMHNCAGKHLGFLAYAREVGLSTEGYDKPDHPLQKEVLNYVSQLSETPLSDIEAGMDGCGAPVYSIPLKNMAISYLKFVAPELIEDQATAEAMVKIGQAMQAYPEIVASHDFVCTALLQDPNIIAKGGAQGVYCFALKEERISVALKVLSGSELVWPNVLAGVLEKINYKNQDTIDRLLAISDAKIKNDSGLEIGDRKVLL